MSSRIVVVGGGFAGLWAAASAARLRASRNAQDRLEIILVAPDAFHAIRVRCYEEDLDGIRIPLDDVLEPIQVTRRIGRVVSIDAVGQRLAVRSDDLGPSSLAYDRLVLAPGSALTRPTCPGAECAFDVDTVAGAEQLASHIATLGAAPAEGRWSAVVLGAGLVGIELACELPARLARARAASPDLPVQPPTRVVLVDRGAEIGASMGAAAPSIRQALAAAQVEIRTNASAQAIDAKGFVLSDGTRIAAATVVAATGMRASPLAAEFGVPLDTAGRLPVDALLRVEGVPAVYAAGDIARARADDSHVTVMSCQHARPMGRLAGHNAACDLLGCPQERIAFAAPDYVTVLDLGEWGAVYTSGWERRTLVAQGASAKATKRIINRSRIYPPTDRDAAAILAAAAPAIQTRPSVTR